MNPHTNQSGEYCIYLRKSRKDLEEEERGAGDTLKRHRDTLLALAAKLKVNVTYIYEEVVSGDTIAERPQMQKLLDAVEQGVWKGVLVMEIPRLARGDTIDQGVVAQAFRYSDTLIITPEKTYHPSDEFDEEYMEFGLFMSRREYKAINRRIQRGRLFSVQEGKWVANKAPYGWRRVKLAHEKGYTLEPDDSNDRANILVMMYEWAYHPQPMPDGSMRRMKPASITNRLNEMGIPSPNGGKWTACVVRDILLNPVNAGWVRWRYRPEKKTVVNGEVLKSNPRSAPEDVLLYPGRHKGRISQEMFDSVKAFVTGNPSRPGPKQVSMKNPLSGLVFCGECGHAMVRRPYQSGRQETLLCPHKYCHTVASDLAVVEQEILLALERWLHDVELEFRETDAGGNGFDPSSSLRTALAALEKERDQLSQQEQRAYELVEQGVYSTEVFLQRSRAITEKQRENGTQIETLTSEITMLERQEQSRKEIAPRIRTVLEAYPLAETPKEKNDLLKSAIEKVVYQKTKRNRWAGGGDMEITLYPRLPE